MGPREADAASFDQRVKVWQSEVDAALLDAVTIFGVDGFQGAGAAQDAGQEARRPLRNVHHHEHRRRQVGRQVPGQPSKCLHPARGGPDHHRIVWVYMRPLWVVAWLA